MLSKLISQLFYLSIQTYLAALLEIVTALLEYFNFCAYNTYTFKNNNNNHFTYEMELWCALWSYLVDCTSLPAHPSEIVYIKSRQLELNYRSNFPADLHWTTILIAQKKQDNCCNCSNWLSNRSKAVQNKDVQGSILNSSIWSCILVNITVTSKQ